MPDAKSIAVPKKNKPVKPDPVEEEKVDASGKPVKPPTLTKSRVVAKKVSLLEPAFDDK